MAERAVAHGQRRGSAADARVRRWLIGAGLAVTVGVAYFFAGRLGVGLILKPEGVAVFWPAAGISSGVLIALGRRARWPVAAGVIAATVVVHLLIADPLWAGIALGVSNAAEALITAELIAYYFGTDFSLDRLRQVIGLLVAAIVGTAVSGVGGAATYRLYSGPSAEILTSWQHWFASDAIGIIIVAPLVIGIAAALRRPPPRSELIEGAAALTALAVATGVVIFLPAEFWVTVLPIAALFPILLWVTARCRPVYAAAAAFLVCITFVATAVFGFGHFGDARILFADRILQAQSAILFVALGAFVLAALFAERSDSEARLTRSNTMLERERDNKLMNAQAITAAIAHEVRQPLAAIATNAGAARRFLRRPPPDLAEVEAALGRIIGESHRTSEVFDSIRALFRKADEQRQPIDINELIRAVLQSSAGELKDRGVAVRAELMAELPRVVGHTGQLQEVVLNLTHNALEAMATTTDRGRLLQVRSALHGRDAVAVEVEDTGPGIDAKQLEGIFGAFVTTKSHGMGLGLAICRMIVEQHGGQLTASSDGASGSLFRFVLPIAAP
ncbi:MAG TPA: MASE1 domain-containing protein [Xanthobacteraceae bacterium]|nr:MASE1 domain-containing protein [Xanthobacteraceae bacterium]